MSKGDELIEKCGYRLISEDTNLSTITYHNVVEDCAVTIDYYADRIDPDWTGDCIITSYSISEERDWFGNPR